tara:strand:- start:903 stop:1472 length:570 start_codon:yes stop_codon:yes gene_type:complete
MSKKSTTKKLTETLKLKLRNEFVQGIDNKEGIKSLPSLEDLIKKSKVAKSTLYRVSKEENWKVEREIYQTKYKEKLDKDRIKNLADESKSFDITSVTIAKSILATVGQNISHNAKNINEGKQGLPPSQINALASAAVTAQRLAKLALGEATETMNINANIKDTEAFRSAMELLDSVAEQRRESDSKSVH